MTRLRIALAVAVVAALGPNLARAQAAPAAPAPVEVPAPAEPRDTAAPVVPCESLTPKPRPLNATAFMRRLERSFYPRMASARTRQGGISLRLIIGADGRVSDGVVRGTSGIPEMDTAALDAAMDLRFTRPTGAGEPVRCWADLPIEYQHGS